MFRTVRVFAGGIAALVCIAGAGCGGGGSSGGGGGGSGSTPCPEIFATGFRNPWRMSFDPDTGRLYVGDVGQSAQEEIDLVTLGANYGWDCLEGELDHSTTANCSATFTEPEVVHGRTDAKAIAGGVVYRGAAIPSLDGFYVYGDFLTERFFAFDADDPGADSERITQLNAPVAAFGQDRDGEIYAVTHGSPSIRRIVSSGSGLAALAFADAFPGRTFDDPVKLVQHPTVDDRWYVVEQGGLVKTFLASNSLAPTIAADVDSTDPGFVSGGEQGLLGMAFDPGFTQSGEIYLAYTRGDTAILARWVSVNAGLTFRPDAGSIVLSIVHPETNHNGGDLAFGPDGFLYYSMGDGGGADDPDNNGQNPNRLLGKILRIDVNSMPPSGRTYAIPTGNPNASNPHCG